MTRLQAFGEPAAETSEDTTVPYFGAEFRLHPEFGEGTFVDWMEEHGELDVDDPKNNVKLTLASKRLMRAVIHPDDFDRFWSHAKHHKQGSERLVAFVDFLIGQVTGRPTNAPSDSSPGRETTASGSRPVSTLRELAQGPLSGRPDLLDAAAQRLEAQGGLARV